MGYERPHVGLTKREKRMLDLLLEYARRYSPTSKYAPKKYRKRHRLARERPAIPVERRSSFIVERVAEELGIQPKSVYSALSKIRMRYARAMSFGKAYRYYRHAFLRLGHDGWL